MSYHGFGAKSGQTIRTGGVESEAPADAWHMLTRNESNSFEFAQQSAGTKVLATRLFSDFL